MTRERISHTAGPGLLVVFVACLASFAIGFTGSSIEPIALGVLSMLPIALHCRHVGVRHAITNPSPVTVVLIFYVLIVPLRAVVVAANDYRDVLQLPGAITSHDLVPVLSIVAVATSCFVEAYYLVSDWGLSAAQRSSRDTQIVDLGGATIFRLAIALSALALYGLADVILRYGSIKSAQAALLPHQVTAALQGQDASSSPWALFADPAVWACVAIVSARSRPTWQRVAATIVTIVILAAQLVVYGSRLNAILAGVGAWVILYYSGRRISVRTLVVCAVLIVAVSIPVLSGRGVSQSRVSTVENLSRIVGYDVLDASLAVWQQPEQIRRELKQSQRWENLPAYLVPSFLWHGRPNINTVRLGLYVARAIGSINDQYTGFPTTFVIEGWLLGGWPGALLLAGLFGGLVGLLQRWLLLSRAGKTASAKRLFFAAFLVITTFTYFKDGDIVVTLTGAVRDALYLAVIVFLCGLQPTRWRLGNAGSRPAMRVLPTVRGV